MPSLISIVGAGLGYPELITVKALYFEKGSYFILRQQALQARGDYIVEREKEV